jgi:hypothetical protein
MGNLRGNDSAERAPTCVLLASRHHCYFTATIVRVSVFVTGVQNSQEITHEAIPA